MFAIRRKFPKYLFIDHISISPVEVHGDNHLDLPSFDAIIVDRRIQLVASQPPVLPGYIADSDTASHHVIMYDRRAAISPVAGSHQEAGRHGKRQRSR
jgi:hypothetical protein